MTKEKIEAKKALLDWCHKKGWILEAVPRHIFPVAYVVGYAAPRCLMVARPWTHSEPQCADWDRKYPLATIHTFDKDLKPGDWCICGFIRGHGCGESIAIKIP